VTGKESGHLGAPPHPQLAVVDGQTKSESAASRKVINPDALEVVAGHTREQVEGWIPELASEAEIRDALEKAFDYRGDVTITLKDGSRVDGYIFDRRTGSGLESSVVRIMPQNARKKIAVRYSDIAALAFSGRDMAAGNSWESWVRKYWEKKAAGEKGISRQPENLE
jgi:hypothetical protein